MWYLIMIICDKYGVIYIYDMRVDMFPYLVNCFVILETFIVAFFEISIFGIVVKYHYENPLFKSHLVLFITTYFN